MATEIAMYSVKEAAQKLNLSERTVRWHCKNERLGRPVGHSYVITDADIKQFLKLPRLVGNPNFRKGA